MKWTIFFLAFGICMQILAACSSNNYIDPGEGSVGVQVVATTVQDLYERSEIIVIGRAIEINDVINMARDVYDPSKPDLSFFIVGQVYKVHVEEYLKGGGPKTIYIVQEEGYIRNIANPTKDQILIAREESGYIPIKLEKEYLFYLRLMLGGPDETYFSGTSHPWRFNLEDREKIKPESPWKDAEKYFPNRSLTETISIFNTPMLSSTSPYPSPVIPYP